MNRTILAFSLTATLLAAGSASAIDLRNTVGAGVGAVKGLTLSDEDIRKTAEESCAAYDGLNKIAPAGNKYATRLAQLTRGLDNEDGMSLNFKVYLVNDVNAFAMANGCVRVFAGLMDVATDDEIRAVIGHEIGHVKLGHSKSKMKTAILTRAARQGAAATGGKGGQLAQSELGGVAEDVINAQFSQKEESAADAYGYKFMVKHKYDPNAMISLFGKLGGKGGLMSSHPSSPKRVKGIEKMIKNG